MKPWVQIALGIGLIIWGGGSLIYQMQPGVIGIKSIPIIVLIAGIANLYIGVKRNNNPEKDALAKTQQEANEAVFPAPPKRSPPEISEELKEGDIYQYLLNSYSSWKAGVFDAISDYYKKTATKDSPEALTATMLNEAPFVTFLEQCFKVRQPDTSEYMFIISPNNFMLTNKCLYINTKLKEGTLHTIPLCDIVAYSSKGLWMKTGVLALKNGDAISVKLDAVPDEGMLKQLQEQLNCDQSIEV